MRARHGLWIRPTWWRVLSVGLALVVVVKITDLAVVDRLDGWVRDDAAANATLEFGQIFVVSRPHSPRQIALRQAAERSGLDVVIPAQPRWSSEQIAAVRARKNSALDRKSALTWLSHQRALATFLHGDDETALIVEDDVAWDMYLRSEQIPRAAHAIRAHLGSEPGQGYYDPTTGWDVLWLGHCGDFFNASRGAQISNIQSYHDPTMPVVDDLHPWTQDFLRAIGADHRHRRLVHPSVAPLCAFAYAVTRRSAARLLHDLAKTEPEREANHKCAAYDVRLLEARRDQDLRCVSVNPELFHHVHVPLEEDPGSGCTDPVSESAADYITPNIQCPARSMKWLLLKQDEGGRQNVPRRSNHPRDGSRPMCPIENITLEGS